MTPAAMLELMQRPERWPMRVLLPLAHRTREDRFGMPLQGFLAYGHGATLYRGNVSDDFAQGETTSRTRFECALGRFEKVTYLSLAAILGDGWRVD